MCQQINHERTLELSFEAWKYLKLAQWGYSEKQDNILMPGDPEFANWIPGPVSPTIQPAEIPITMVMFIRLQTDANNKFLSGMN